MSANGTPGNGNAEIDMSDDDLPDLSPAAVNRRLAAFVAEVRATPAAERRDKYLCAWAVDALAAQASADLAKAEADARLATLERDHWRKSGRNLQ